MAINTVIRAATRRKSALSTMNELQSCSHVKCMPTTTLPSPLPLQPPAPCHTPTTSDFCPTPTRLSGAWQPLRDELQNVLLQNYANNVGHRAQSIQSQQCQTGNFRLLISKSSCSKIVQIHVGAQLRTGGRPTFHTRNVRVVST